MSHKKPFTTGEQFGFLIVIAENDERVTINGKSCILCLCTACNRQKQITASSIREGKAKSCGCLLGTDKHPSYKHGKTGTRIHTIWRNMMRRCYNEKDKDFCRYGARGITVCERWHVFENFLLDMGEPSKDLSLDRILIDVGYSPENCRWATTKEQANNKRTNRFITFEEKTQTMRQWDREKGFSPGLVARRMKTGCSIEEALTKPVRRWGE